MKKWFKLSKVLIARWLQKLLPCKNEETCSSFLQGNNFCYCKNKQKPCLYLIKALSKKGSFG